MARLLVAASGLTPLNWNPRQNLIMITYNLEILVRKLEYLKMESQRTSTLLASYHRWIHDYGHRKHTQQSGNGVEYIVVTTDLERTIINN